MIRSLPVAVMLATLTLALPAIAQGQQQAPGAIPPPGTPLPNLPPLPDVNKNAFKQVTEEAAPLTPEQIKALRKLVDDAERAAAAPPRFVPKPVSSAVTVSLQPGTTPPVVRLFSNYVSNIMFVDQVGNPLVVDDVDPGAASQFNVTWSQKAKSQAGSNVIKLSPKAMYASGNISVSLDGVMTPISLTLVSGQREVDYRVDVRVKGVGGTGRSAAGSALPEGVNPVMQGMLEGIAPDGAKTLTASSGEVSAWEYRNRFYVRTNYTLLSPAYTGIQKSADGSTVYEIPPVSVLVAVSGGTTININLSGY